MTMEMMEAIRILKIDIETVAKTLEKHMNDSDAHKP